MSSKDEVEQFLAILRRLRIDRSKGVQKPYKPLLLAAVVLLIGKGKLRSSGHRTPAASGATKAV